MRKMRSLAIMLFASLLVGCAGPIERSTGGRNGMDARAHDKYPLAAIAIERDEWKRRAD